MAGTGTRWTSSLDSGLLPSSEKGMASSSITSILGVNGMCLDHMVIAPVVHGEGCQALLVKFLVR